MNPEILYWICLFSLLIFNVFTSATENGVNFQVCPTSVPNYNECLRNSLQEVLPNLKNGYSKYKIPALEPFYIPKLEIKEGRGAVNLDLTFQKIKIHGLTNGEIQKVVIDPQTLSDGYMKVLFKKPLYLIGSYTAKGKMQVFPINGNGFCNITLINAAIEINNLAAETVQRKEIKYIKIKSIQARMSQVEKVILRLDNIFPGNKEISENLNTVLNENWQLLYDEIRPALEDTAVAIIKNVAEFMLYKIPHDQIFPKQDVFSMNR